MGACKAAGTADVPMSPVIPLIYPTKNLAINWKKEFSLEGISFVKL